MQSEIFVIATAALLGVSLVLARTEGAQRAREALFHLGMLAAASAIVWRGWTEPGGPIFGLLVETSLFRAPRAAIFLSASLVARIIAGTRQISEGRKPEALFLLASSVLLCDTLLLSNNLALSFVLLVVFSWIGTFLSGMAFRGMREGEAVMKHWVQGSIAAILSLGGLVVVSALAGGVQYEQIAAHIAGLAEYSPARLFMILVLYLPFLMVAGLFPFHLAPVDRDEGAPWAVQSLLAVIGSGTVVLALWGVGVRIFGTEGGSQIQDGLRCLQYCGLIGGFWLAFFALDQKKSKRLFSGMVGGFWSLLLVSGSMRGSMAASSVVYGACSTLLWGTLLSFVWSRLQENAGDELISTIYGSARVRRGYGLLLLCALASPLLFPAFPGFASIILQLAAVIEQSALLLLVFFAILQILFLVIAARLTADLLFRKAIGTGIRLDLVRYDSRDLYPLAVLLLAMIGFGTMGNRVFTSLFESAKLFLN